MSVSGAQRQAVGNLQRVAWTVSRGDKVHLWVRLTPEPALCPDPSVPMSLIHHLLQHLLSASAPLQPAAMEAALPLDVEDPSSSSFVFLGVARPHLKNSFEL